MIRSLRIERYRGFADFKVEHVAPINLFVGRNNTGKTSILEAAYLLSVPNGLSALAEIARRRNEGGRYLDRERGYILELVDISHAFKGHKADSSSIKISEEESSGIEISCKPLSASTRETKSKPDGPFAGPSTSLLLHQTRNGKPISTAEITDTGFLEDSRRRRSSPMAGAVFISPESFLPDLLPIYYNAIVLSASEQRLVDALKILDDKINGVFPLAGTTGGEISPASIILGSNGSERNPLGSYGDGMRRLLSLVIGFANVRNETLLIDEIDTGLHYTIMSKLWDLVIRTSSDFNTQVFATTHSLDCVHGLRDALEENPTFAAKVAIHKIDCQLDSAITFTGADLMFALRNDVELR